MDFDEFVSSLSSVGSRAKTSVRGALISETDRLLQDFRARSPIDSSLFQSSWYAHIQSGELSVTIKNPLIYAPFVDDGAEPGKPPWNFPKGGKGRGNTVSKSGKVILKNNRVWAGGLSPTGFVIGGISDSILMNSKKRQKEIARSIATSIIGVI